MTRARISVAMCTYNGERHVGEQLESIAAQSRLPDELVLHDDGSTDGTLPIVHAFAARAGFPVRIATNPTRLGSTANFGRAIAVSAGDVIALADQDDVWRPDKLARIEAAFDAAPGAGCVFSDADVVGERLEPLGYRLWDSVPLDRRRQRRMRNGGALAVLLRQNYVTGATMALRSDLRDLVLPIPSAWVHDGWIAVLAAAVGGCVPVSEPLVQYRQHAGQQIGGLKRTLRQQIAVARGMNAGFFDELARNYGLVLERLISAGRHRCPESALDLIRAKIEHCLRRVRIREARLAVGLIGLEVLSGRYRRYSLGWKSVASDLFL